MTKKVTVTKEWHQRAMKAMGKMHELESICEALQKFPLLHLEPEKQTEFESLLSEYLDREFSDGTL